MAEPYHEGARRLQDRFDTRRLADRIDERFLREAVIGAADRAFIERMDMFFLATADAEGRPSCSYKGGDPGFVRVLDERTLAFPNYDGNGMDRSGGNPLANPHLGLLFIDWEGQGPPPVEGEVRTPADDPLLGEWPESQFVIRVRIARVFPNCPRYIHRMELVERSPFVPRPAEETPIPRWKRADWMTEDALPAGDPARDPEKPGR